VSIADRLAAAAASFLDALDGQRRAIAALSFDETERRTWAYWPTARRGIPLAALDRTQTKTAFRVLAELLAEPAFARAAAIIALEEVLDRRNGYRDDRRHIGDYWLTVFGEPGGDPWGVRFEGHHVSVHATIAGGDVRLTPLFLGANPAVVTDGSQAVSAPLGPEERLGFDLLHALSVEQRSAAVIADTAPDDILTRNAPRIDEPPPDDGVPLAALAGEAARTAHELLGLYLARFPPGVERRPPGDVRFAWAGAAEPGVGHYYRIAGPRLLIELDNTQDDANHVHTVVRDPAGDFGADLFTDHYRRSHR
jgi:Protein of unknown function (DUF3500)